MKKNTSSIIAGLDVGTTKVCAIVGEVTDKGVSILAVNSQPSTGLKKGVVIDIEATANSIKKAVAGVEEQTGIAISEVYVGISGNHIKSFDSYGTVGVKGKEVTREDVERAIDSASAVYVPLDREVLHVLPTDFILDGQDGIKDPVGMAGVRLEVKVFIVTGAVTSVQNLLKCCERAGLEVVDIVLQPLASAEATLTPYERDMGIVLIDIGGGTTDIAVFVKGAIRHTAVIPLGGDQITSDIAMALRTPLAAAEEIKIQQGCALRQLVEGDQKVAVPGVGERGMRQMARQTLVEVIEPRVEEMFSLVLTELRTSRQLDLIPSGVVLTGGSSAMEGMLELGEEIFHVPVRLGVPFYRGPLADVVRKPQFATVMGLLAFGFEEHQKAQGGRSSLLTLGYSWERIKHWFKSSF